MQQYLVLIFLAMVFGACNGASIVSSDGGLSDAPTVVIPDGGERTLSPNDISILFPADRGELWGPDTVGISPTIFAEINANRFSSLQDGVFQALPASREYSTLRVVGIRIEPCASGADCSAELRFVLQSYDAGSFRDGAVHVIHHLDAVAFAGLRNDIADLQRLAPENADPVLRVNPALAAQGMEGAFGVLLRQRLSSRLSDATLFRVTFMTRTDARRGTWQFGGLNFVRNAVTGTSEIVGFPNARVQTVSDELSNGHGVDVDVGESGYPDSAFALAMRPMDVAMRSRSEQQNAFDAVVRRQNPTMLTPNTTDCAGCHLASLIRSRPFWRSFSSTLSYSGEAVAQRSSGRNDDDPNNLRAFGYFQREPVVSQRVANDTHFSLMIWPQ